MDLSPYKNCLAHLAFDPKNSKGRPYTGKLDEDYDFFNVLNPCFIDNDKVNLSKVIRREKEKTQVHKGPSNPHVRERLAHTIEVTTAGKKISKITGLNTDLTEAEAMGHDAGHGPYGHTCERVLSELLKEETGDPSAVFRHELNGVLVLELCERKGRGLNLCYETIEGILNHSSRENPLIITPGLPQEHAVVKIADKISYITSDVNDAILKKMLSINNPDHKLIFDCVKKLGWDEVQKYPKQRDIMKTFTHAVCKESYEKGFVSFSEGEVFETFSLLKDQMFEQVYKKVKWDAEIKLIKQVFSILRDAPLNKYIKACELGGFKPRNPEFKPNPYLVTSLLTDEEMGRLRKVKLNPFNSISLKKLILKTSLYQIVPYLMDNPFDLTSIYHKWCKYDNKSVFLDRVLWPLLVEHHNA